MYLSCAVVVHKLVRVGADVLFCLLFLEVQSSKDDIRSKDLEEQKEEKDEDSRHRSSLTTSQKQSLWGRRDVTRRSAL